MGRISDVVLDSCNCTHDLSSGAQMGNVSQSFKRDFLACQWVLFVIVSTENLDLLEFGAGEFHFDELALSFGFDHFTLDFERVVHFGFLDIFPVGNGVLNDDLKWSGARAVNKLDEQESVISLESGLTGPTDNRNDFIKELLLVFVDVLDSVVFSDEELWSVFFNGDFGDVEGSVFVESVFGANETSGKGEIDVDGDNVGLNNLLCGLFGSGDQVFGKQFVHLIHCKKMIELKYYFLN